MASTRQASATITQSSTTSTNSSSIQRPMTSLGQPTTYTILNVARESSSVDALTTGIKGILTTTASIKQGATSYSSTT
ncbi:hypothetical protein ACJMK2_022774, partial [Sinanodonta woodiana]